MKASASSMDSEFGYGRPELRADPNRCFRSGEQRLPRSGHGREQRFPEVEVATHEADPEDPVVHDRELQTHATKLRLMEQACGC